MYRCRISSAVSARAMTKPLWILTSYLVANAIILPKSAWLSRVFGRKRHYMMSVALFTLTSFLCGSAPGESREFDGNPARRHSVRYR